MKTKGVMPFGESNGQAVLTESQVREILILRKTYWYGSKRISEILGFGRWTIHAIIYGRNWSHIYREIIEGIVA